MSKYRIVEHNITRSDGTSLKTFSVEKGWLGFWASLDNTYYSSYGRAKNAIERDRFPKKEKYHYID